ncbi:MAG: S-methyl-5-thioribose-1-phosphate isomerase [Candidatus Omnitrophica bacterium]|jgi:methylthioribose-1-phosphate isomerase|nr:S-methyl-5-thioribose-1-phosphate isomerase [Candidatus Omnitrophota bacterium]
MKYSPLFWPVKLKGNIIYVLDETLLPSKVKYLKIKSYQESCQVIKEMKTRAVGQVLLVLYTFILVIKNNKGKVYLPLLEKVASALNSTRPTLSFRFLTDMVINWAKSKLDISKCISAFLENLKNSRLKQAKEVSTLIKDGDTVLTHCNISGLMPLIGEFCRQENKKINFFVTETRPYLQGLRLTAWELYRAGFKTTVITDNMVAKIMQENKISKVIVGADNLAQNGDIANKIGTYQIAILAKHFGIPFYVICPPVSSAKTGKDIRIEIRPDKELLEIKGVSIGPKGVCGYYPAFDITPNKLITKHIYLEV